MRNIELTMWDLRNHRERFMDKVKVGPSCWYWIGGKNNQGAGVIGITRAGERRPRSVYAHRVALYFYKDVIPQPDEDVRHTCGCLHCVNPHHLEIVKNPRRGDA